MREEGKGDGDKDGDGDGDVKGGGRGSERGRGRGREENVLTNYSCRRIILHCTHTSKREIKTSQSVPSQ